MATLCRVCLRGDLRFRSVQNNLTNVYNALANTEFNSRDPRPRVVCSLCYQKLQKCYTFSKMVQRSEHIFSQLFSNGVFEITREAIAELNLRKKQRYTTPTQCSNTVNEKLIKNSSTSVKDESTTVKADSLANVESKPDSTVADDEVKSAFLFEVPIINQTNESRLVNSNQGTESNAKFECDIVSVKDEPIIVEDCLHVEPLSYSTLAEEIEELHTPFLYGDVSNRRNESTLKKVKSNYHGTDSNMTFECDTCRQSFNCKPLLIKHLSRNHLLKSNLYFTEKTALINIMRTQHSGEKPFACPSCDKTFTAKKDLNRHSRIHTGVKPFACFFCHKKFTENTTLINHMRTHSGEKPFACSFCDKAFTAKRDLTRHIKIHTGEKPYACIYCGKTFTENRDLTRHIRIHTGEKPFVCSHCDKTFTAKKDLTRHMKIHTGVKPFVCFICDKKFTENRCLTRHSKIHTGEKPFACSYCGKTFTEKKDLTRHIRIHTGEKPYACSFCDKKFTERSTLINHTRTHSGEKPFACSYCDKTFTAKRDLTRHIRVHNGEKLFT